MSHIKQTQITTERVGDLTKTDEQTCFVAQIKSDEFEPDLSKILFRFADTTINLVAIYQSSQTAMGRGSDTQPNIGLYFPKSQILRTVERKLAPLCHLYCVLHVILVFCRDSDYENFSSVQKL